MNKAYEKVVNAEARLKEAKKKAEFWALLRDIENGVDRPRPEGYWLEYGLLYYRDHVTGEPCLLGECPLKQASKAKKLVEEAQDQLEEAKELYRDLVAQSQEGEESSLTMELPADMDIFMTEEDYLEVVKAQEDEESRKRRRQQQSFLTVELPEGVGWSPEE